MKADGSQNTFLPVNLPHAPDCLRERFRQIGTFSAHKTTCLGSAAGRRVPFSVDIMAIAMWRAKIGQAFAGDKEMKPTYFLATIALVAQLFNSATMMATETTVCSEGKTD
jgi:hypothetical protein